MTQTPAPARPRPETSTARPAASGWFRAFWRWHFYASFLVIPILLMLSVTGLIYLLRFQIEPLLHADLMRVEQPAESAITQPYVAQQNAVEAAYPDATVVAMSEPADLESTTRFSIETAEGASRDVYVDPWNAEVLGALDPDRTLSGMAVLLHGELMAGKPGDYLIELGACWAIVMALTGYFLFFKGRAARRRIRQAGVKGAALRQRHAAVGSVVGISVLFLLVSGLPWTGFWGEKAQNLATKQNTSLWSEDPGAASDPTSTLDKSLPHSHAHEVPWALGGTDVPSSEEGEEGRNVANVDTAVTVASEAGLRHPMTVVMPGEETGVFSVIGYAFDAPSDEGTVHIDRFGGTVVSEYGYDDYPALAKVVSQGIGLHEGRSLGLVSFWGALVMCLLVMFMCITGPTMWWRRRPRGARSMAAPRGRMPIRTTPLLAIGIVALGVFLPFFGLSLLVILLLDQLLLRRVPAFRNWFDVSAR